MNYHIIWEDSSKLQNLSISNPNFQFDTIDIKVIMKWLFTLMKIL